MNAPDVCPGSGRPVPVRAVYTCLHCKRAIAATGSGRTWSIARHMPRPTAYVPNTAAVRT